MKDLLERLLGIRIKLITNNGIVLEGVLNRDFGSQLFYLFDEDQVVCFNLSLVNGIIVPVEQYENNGEFFVDYKEEV